MFKAKTTKKVKVKAKPQTARLGCQVLLTLSLGGSLSLSAFASSEPRKVAFREAIEMAIEQSPSLATIRSELFIRDQEYKNSYSVFLPSLDIAATQGLRGSNRAQNNNDAVSELSLQLTENLYDNGISLARFDSARFQKEIAELSYRNERDKLILSLAFEYMRYSLAYNLAEVREQQFNIVNKQYQSVSNQYQQGVKTRRDYLRFKTELRRSEIELQNSRANVEKSRFELMRILGFELSAKVEPFVFKPISVDVKSVAQVPKQTPDLSSHYQYRIASLQRKVFANDVYIVRRDFWPQLFLNAGATYHTGDFLGNNFALVGKDTTSWNALVTMRFNILDWGIRRRNISIADAKRNQAENSLANDLNSFSADNAKMMLELNQSFSNYAVSRELLELETKSYGFLDGEYRNGKVSYLDIIVGLRDLLNAKVQLFSSYYDLKGQLLRYRYHEGRLYESISDL